MSPLSHAAAHERLADLALEPGALDRIGSPVVDALAAHVASCDTCRRDVDAWRRTHERLEAARGTGVDRVDLADLARDEPIAAPAELRGTILRAVRELPATAEPTAALAPAATAEPTPISRPAPVAVPMSGSDRTAGITPESAAASGEPTRLPIVRRLPIMTRLLPLVAVLAIAVFGTGVLVDQSSRLDRARQDTARLESVAATLDRVLRDPAHEVVALRSPDGTASGTISWSAHDVVVLTTALAPPPADRIYRCWIERDGTRSPVGQMWFSGGTAFWNGSLDGWATISLDAGGTFGVSLEPAADAAGNPAVLSAELGA